MPELLSRNSGFPSHAPVPDFSPSLQDFWLTFLFNCIGVQFQKAHGYLPLNVLMSPVRDVLRTSRLPSLSPVPDSSPSSSTGPLANLPCQVSTISEFSPSNS